MPTPASSRLGYIDWARGLACLLMFQTHCYDAWLSGNARSGTFFMWSQLGGTFPAPLFLFLAGISVALVVDKLYRKGLAPSQIAGKVMRRGAEIFILGLLFRLQEFVIALGWAPWSDLLRVDILNTIGASIMLLGALVWAAQSLGSGGRERLVLGGASTFVALLIALLTPLLWTSWRPSRLPWPILTYVDGSHNQGQPVPGLFPLFPWSGFAFAGLAFGVYLFSDRGRAREGRTLAIAGACGLALVYFARWMDARPVQLYATYDFWHTSPNFFLIRVGYLLAILGFAYAWCRWGAGVYGFSPLVQLGQASLLVYWVHLEFVYGKFSILPRHSQDIRGASFGLLAIFLAMLLLSVLRVRWKGRGSEWLTRRRIPARAG
jgi:uncharacterized membrane protein